MVVWWYKQIHNHSYEVASMVCQVTVNCPQWLGSKEYACNSVDTEDVGSISIGKIPWRGAWKPFQYSCLENPMDRGAWQAAVHRVAKSWTQLN